MRAVGIIAEYNPFHNGHQLQINEAKKSSDCSHAICVMSGNFMQRGEPAIFDKWKRAEMAVTGGADLVLELPVVFAVRSAQYFAQGGVRLLNALGVVGHLSFGAEHPDLEILQKIAEATENKEVIEALQLNLQNGQTYAAALSNAILSIQTVPKEILTSPNNILAIEYLRSIRKFAPTIIPIAIKRQHANYHDINITGSIASATAIRRSLVERQNDDISRTVPPEVYSIIQEITKNQRGPSEAGKLDNIILAKLRTTKASELEKIPDVSEGLHNKMMSSALEAGNTTELLALIKSRRYTGTRLRRILIHLLLGTSQAEIVHFDKQGPLYARVLAFNKKGRELLGEINKTSSIPLVTKTTHYLNSRSRNNHDLDTLQKMLSYDTLATDIYTLSLPAAPWTYGGLDFRHSPIYHP
ncbi:nucleotidyltransferase [Dendrosporobacter sp. 1207_IL3150]|uniref:nucleotidyltransferase n=1 Tax=Dendrosporobacter sp. 1207_IL3150 TaxID=3084054 RepID=UPI002FD9080D